MLRTVHYHVSNIIFFRPLRCMAVCTNYIFVMVLLRAIWHLLRKCCFSSFCDYAILEILYLSRIALYIETTCNGPTSRHVFLQQDKKNTLIIYYWKKKLNKENKQRKKYKHAPHPHCHPPPPPPHTHTPIWLLIVNNKCDGGKIIAMPSGPPFGPQR